MRKKLAWYGIVVLLVALGASTLASAHTRPAAVADGESSAKATDSSSQGTLTLPRLLQSRLRWTRQLALALRFLELPPPAPSVGTLTIIDEPDPAGVKDEPLPETGDEEDQGPPDLIDEETPLTIFQLEL